MHGRRTVNYVLLLLQVVLSEDLNVFGGNFDVEIEIYMMPVLSFIMSQIILH
jgi:hypothetical protein